MAELPPPFDDRSFREHARFVRALAGALARDRDEADEVAARTFARAVEQRPRAGAQLRGWLARVARRALSRLRRDDARRDAHESAAARSERIDADPADLAARTELTDRIALAFAQLDEPAKSTLFLRFFADLSPKQIAARQQVPVETVKTRLKRGLAKLRVQLDAQHDRSRGEWRATALALANHGGPLVAAAKLKGVAAAAAVVALAGAAAWMWQLRRSEPAAVHEAAGASAEGARALEDGATTPATEAPVAAAAAQEASPQRVEEKTLPFATGVVVDEHGAPIQGTRVVASFEDLIVDAPTASRMKLMLGDSFVNNASRLDFASIDRHTLARTDRDGRFVVSTAPDHLAGLHFVAPDRAPASWFDVSSIAAENQDRRVTLERGCVARGRVHDREGRPVLGAWVGASDFDPKPVASVPSPHPVAPTCTGPRPGVLAQQSCVDAEGRFELQLPRRSCRISGVAPGYVDELVDFEPEAGECDITLWRSHALLDVVDARMRAPVPAVHTLVLRMDRPEHGRVILPAQLFDRIAPDSRNTIPTPPARLIVPSSAELFLFADGYRSRPYVLAFGPGDEPPHETIALEPGVEPVTIAGTVRGARKARVEVRWIPNRPEPSEVERSIRWLRQALRPDDIDPREAPLTSVDVDRDNRFAFRGLPAGTWCIDIAAAGRTPRRRVVTAPVTDLAFDLAASAQLEVAVVDASGSPCAGVDVHVQTADDARAWSKGTNAAGLATFGGLPDVELWIVAARELHDCSFPRSAFSRDDDVTLAAGETRHVTLKLVEPVPVTLFVHDVENRPIDEASLAISVERILVPDLLIRDETRDLAGRIFTTDVDGEARVELIPSLYVFEVWAHGHHFHQRVGIGRSAALRIDLPLADD
jgi:RNA polymerase sigma-70 factor (ECF subfamily)